MTEHRYPPEPDPDSTRRAAMVVERDRLALDLHDREAKLNEQAKIFIPLIALCLIFAIPVFSKSPARFLILLLNPFVLLPLGFCVVHLAVAWRGILKVRTQILEWERTTEHIKKV
jgi:hypothetical protein